MKAENMRRSRGETTITIEMRGNHTKEIDQPIAIGEADQENEKAAPATLLATANKAKKSRRERPVAKRDHHHQ